MKLFIASDHGAYWAKKYLVDQLSSNYNVIDLGTDSEDSVDYPRYAIDLAKNIQADQSARGILLCGSGIGVSMVANRFKSVRAALCHNIEEAQLSRAHNNANVLCLPGRSLAEDKILEIAKHWLASEFEGGRHQKRLDQFNLLGE
jgi:ribose 5-phosphate isomerase B